MLRTLGWDTFVCNSLLSSFAVCGSSVKRVSHSWHIVLDTDTLYTFLNFITQCISLLNLHLEPELIIVNIDLGNLHSVYRFLEIHNCAVTSSLSRTRVRFFCFCHFVFFVFFAFLFWVRVWEGRVTSPPSTPKPKLIGGILCLLVGGHQSRGLRLLATTQCAGVLPNDVTAHGVQVQVCKCDDFSAHENKK